MYVYEYMYSGTHTGYALELELQAIVPKLCGVGARSQIWVLGTEPMSPRRATTALNH